MNIEHEIQKSILATIEARDEYQTDQLDGFNDYGVPYRPSDWLERKLTSPERKGFSRALKRLQEAGLIECAAWGFSNRTTHVRPTPALIAQAPELSRGCANRTVLARVLARTKWGRKAAAEARKLAKAARHKTAAKQAK